ncbi:hypothetical protein M3484_02765 [Pseudomonas sp. GX19020]|uniref:hypothetical protein n=1 Tax=Pseudomonas sp. GX19020 TaxID=2942277 RepID=UPI002019706D|nr:hypothetical protein [Pseudomonas sp. GX19020]MCL4065497.1 hypothetical protein [Pseudomonas sp. GX19020]
MTACSGKAHRPSGGTVGLRFLAVWRMGAQRQGADFPALPDARLLRSFDHHVALRGTNGLHQM